MDKTCLRIKIESQSIFQAKIFLLNVAPAKAGHAWGVPSDALDLPPSTEVGGEAKPHWKRINLYSSGLTIMHINPSHNMIIIFTFQCGTYNLG